MGNGFAQEPAFGPCSELVEYLKAEIECIARESGCAAARSRTECNMLAIEWIARNAGEFRRRWEQEHDRSTTH